MTNFPTPQTRVPQPTHLPTPPALDPNRPMRQPLPRPGTPPGGQTNAAQPAPTTARAAPLPPQVSVQKEIKTTTTTLPAGYKPYFTEGTSLQGITDQQLDALIAQVEAKSVKWVVVQPANGEQQQTMDLSQYGKDQIKGSEAAMPNPYKDSVGLLTIGIGHLIDTNQDGKVSAAEWAAYDKLGYPRQNLTDDQIEGLFDADLAPRVKTLNNLLKVPVTPDIFDALASLAFNIGLGQAAFAGSDLLAKLNKGDYDSLPEEFYRWVFANRQKSKGLQRRRIREVLGFATPYVKK